MREINEKLQEKLAKLESGDLELNELESLVEDARELYERLLIVKYKAYENYGEPKAAEQEEEPVIEKSSEPEEIEKEEEKEESIDFSAMAEEPEDDEQPSFDFSAINEEEKENEPVMIPSEDIKSFSDSDSSEDDTFPLSSGTKDQPSDTYQDSHVEKHEEEDENSLNQKLQGTEDDLSLRKKLQSTPVSDLKSEISIAKKFEYITFMFEGKNEKYEEALAVLNNCTDGEDAKDKLNEYSTTYNWDLENKSIIKFVELVERRYL